MSLCLNLLLYLHFQHFLSETQSEYEIGPFKLAGLDWTAEIGATPWANDFYNVSADPECSGSDGFAVCDISLGASKEIKITDSFSVPAFAKVTVNPRTEGAYFVFGLSF